MVAGKNQENKKRKKFSLLRTLFSLFMILPIASRFILLFFSLLSAGFLGKGNILISLLAFVAVFGNVFAYSLIGMAFTDTARECYFRPLEKSRRTPIKLLGKALFGISSFSMFLFMALGAFIGFSAGERFTKTGAFPYFEFFFPFLVLGAVALEERLVKETDSDIAYVVAASRIFGTSSSGRGVFSSRGGFSGGGGGGSFGGGGFSGKW